MKRCVLVIVYGLAVLNIPMDAQEQKEQTPKPAEGERISKVIPVKYADVDSLANALKPFPVVIRADRNLKVLTVSGSPSAVAALEEAIKKLDVPPPARKNVDITAYLIVGSGSAATGEAVPGELEPVIAQMRKTFLYKGFRLLNTLMLRAGESKRVDASGVAGEVIGRPAIYQFSIANVAIDSEAKSHEIRLSQVRFNLRVPVSTGNVKAGAAGNPLVNTQFQYIDHTIATDIDIREGQKVVVGKTSYDSPENGLFLVLTAKIVE